MLTFCLWVLVTYNGRISAELNSCTEIIWLAMHKIFTIQTLTEKVCTPLKPPGILKFKNFLVYLLDIANNLFTFKMLVIYQVSGIILAAVAKYVNKTDKLLLCRSYILECRGKERRDNEHYKQMCKCMILLNYY